MTVPAFPTSTLAGPKNFPGVITKSPLACSVMPQPIAFRPAIISALSRECNGLRRVDGVFAREARMSARLVADLEPGIVIEALIGLLP